VSALAWLLSNAAELEELAESLLEQNEERQKLALVKLQRKAKREAVKKARGG
jgi:hypothetical protein